MRAAIRSAERGRAAAPAPSVHPSVHLNRVDEWPEAAGREALLLRAAHEALGTARAPLRGEVSITFLPDSEIRELNRRYLGKDRPTDVLAFDLGNAEALLGDVYIAPEAAARAAEEHGLPVEEELVRLVVHGMLHLLGHEHPERDRDGSEMFRLQEELVGRLVPRPEPGDRPHARRPGRAHGERAHGEHEEDETTEDER